MTYLVAAYGVIMSAILGYVLSLWLPERSCQRQTDALRDSLPDR